MFIRTLNKHKKNIFFYTDRCGDHGDHFILFENHIYTCTNNRI